MSNGNSENEKKIDETAKIKKGNTPIMGMRLDVEYQTRLRDFAKAEGLSVVDLEKNLINEYELNKCKRNPSLVGDIEVLENCANTIKSTFVAMSKKLEIQKTEIIESNVNNIKICEDKISELESKIKELNEAEIENKKKLVEMNNVNTVLIAKLNEALKISKDKLEIADNTKEKNTALTAENLELQHFRTEMEGIKKELATTKNNLLSKSKAETENTAEIDKLKAKNAELIKDQNLKSSEMEKKCSEEVAFATQKAALEVRNKLIEQKETLKDKFDFKLEEKQNKFDEKADNFFIEQSEFNKQIRLVNDQIDKARSDLNKVQGEFDTLKESKSKEEIETAIEPEIEK